MTDGIAVLVVTGALVGAGLVMVAGPSGPEGDAAPRADAVGATEPAAAAAGNGDVAPEGRELAGMSGGQAPAQDLEAAGYERILRQDARGRFSKHGWNHYGPGYFELDRETGVLTANGGMGLLWYSAEEFGDFVLELDFRTSEERANSGVFLRVPGVPTSDEYIYHSFEIQIDDASEGIHHTGAVYDAEAPSADASHPTGEWNHFKITFQGSRITVELNGNQVVDWEAEPRGKIRDFAERGYIGLQNHDADTHVQFRNVFVKRLE